MTKINLLEFTNYSREQWLQFLQLQKTTAFNICVPKQTVEHFNDRDAIFIEYFIAACIGQDLSTVTEDFMYSIPPVDAVGQFSFIVISDNFNRLAKVLCVLSNGFNSWSDPTPAFFDYALSFPQRLGYDDTIACGLLLQVCEQFGDNVGSQ